MIYINPRNNNKAIYIQDIGEVGRTKRIKALSMMGISFLKTFNDFFEATSIHGFAYMSVSQTRCTRILWTLIVLAATGVASYLLYETVTGFEENYTSTTIETHSIKEFPFPAVTFDPGDYNSKDAFLRTFLNQLEFTRYKKNSPLRDNDKFL